MDKKIISCNWELAPSLLCFVFATLKCNLKGNFCASSGKAPEALVTHLASSLN